MKYAINIAKKVLFRNKVYVKSFGILLILTNSYLVYYFQVNTSAVQFLSYSMRLGQIALVYFSFISYEYHSFLRSEIIEIPQIYYHETNKLLGANNLVISLLLLIWSINVLGWQLIFYGYSGFSYPPFLLHIFHSVILNCTLPGYVGIIMGVVFALLAKKSKAYCFLMLLLLFSSNIPEKIFTVEEIAGIPIINIFDWFSLLAPNTNYVADNIYGIANESHRWALAIGWISTLLAIVLLKLKPKHDPIHICAIILLLIMSTLCIMRFSKRENDSIIKKDLRPTGTICSEILYRREHLPQESVNSNFEIVACDLNMEIGSRMQIIAKIKVDLTNLDSYDFTLWHSLQIDEITDECGSLLSYERNGDFLTVYTPNTVNEFQIKYTGTCGKYFSNRQAIALPGYIPYYPWAGHITIWDEYHEGIIISDFNSSISFRVDVVSPLNVVCNLPSTGHNTFEGCSETISLYAGLLSSTIVDNEICYCSPVSGYQPSIEAYEQIWNNISSLLGETRDLSLHGKTIFVQPETIMATGGTQEKMVVFSDHVLLGSWVTNTETMCLYYLFNLIPQRNETYLLYDLFQAEMISPSKNIALNIKPMWESLEILTKYTFPSEIVSEKDRDEFAAAATKFRSLWQFQINALGSDTLLREVYQYLISCDFDQNQIEFLYNLGS